MNNLQRLQMEIKDIELEQCELNVYLKENGLEPFKPYDATCNASKRMIYMTALSILESIANNPVAMGDLRIDDMSVSDFYDNLLARIDQLENRIRRLPLDGSNGQGNGYFLFTY